MNPHFIFNALNTIKGYYTSAQPQAGSQFVNKFAKLLRLILEYSNKYIPLDQEVDLLRLYLELSQIRYPDLIDYKIHIDPKLQTQDFSLPSMLLQPFVENAIIHGLVPKGKPGCIDISFQQEGNLLVCAIRDNGIGRDNSKKINKPESHRSLATQITEDRLRILNQGLEVTQPFAIQDLRDEAGTAKGTLVIIKTPLKKIW